MGITFKDGTESRPTGSEVVFDWDFALQELENPEDELLNQHLISTTKPLTKLSTY
jgi:hypothetical protein